MTSNRMSMSEITDWADKSHIRLGDPKQEGLIVLPAEQGKFYVHYNEYCPVDEPKYRKAAIVRGQTAMVALHKFLTANQVPFAMYLAGTKPHFTVNASGMARVEMKQLRYFYALHLDEVGNKPQDLPPGFVDRMTDDGR